MDGRKAYQKLADGRQARLTRQPSERQIMAERGIHAALNDGLMPMDVLLARMRNQPLPDGQFATADQFAAAIAAAAIFAPTIVDGGQQRLQLNTNYAG